MEENIKWEEHWAVIYLLTNIIDGKVYVGKTVNYKKRMNKYKKLHCKSQTKLYRALLKYRWENFTSEIIDKAEDIDCINKLEKFYIKQYDCFGTDKGYNLTEGGEGGEMPEETRKKISESSKGRRKTPEAIQKQRESRKGFKQSASAKEKISKSKTGKKQSIEAIKNRIASRRKNFEKNGFKGYKPTKESIEKRLSTIRRNQEINGKVRKPLSSETKAKMSASSKGKKKSKESIEKMKETKRRQFEANGCVGKNKGYKPTPETIASFQETMRLKREAKKSALLITPIAQEIQPKDTAQIELPRLNETTS